MSSPTGAAPKLLQLQRPPSMAGDVSASKENGLGSPRRSFDSSSGSIRSDSSSIHPLKYTWVLSPLTQLTKTFWYMSRGPGKGTGNATNYSAANKKIASFSSVCYPLIILIPGGGFLGNLFAFSALLEFNPDNDILPVPSSHNPHMGAPVASQRREMVRPSPQTSLRPSMGTTPPCAGRRRVQ